MTSTDDTTVFIWFVTLDGVSIIDPAHLPNNKVAPPVHIEEIIADGNTYDAVGEEWADAAAAAHP